MTKVEFLAILWTGQDPSHRSRCIRLTIGASLAALRMILNLLNASEKIAWFRPRLSRFHLNVFYLSGESQHATDVLSRLGTDGQEKSDLDKDLPICNAENIQVTSDETRYLHGCKECDVENDLITVKADKEHTERIETRVRKNSRRSSEQRVTTYQQSKSLPSHGRHVLLRGASRNTSMKTLRCSPQIYGPHIEDRLLPTEKGTGIAERAHYPSGALSSNIRKPW